MPDTIRILVIDDNLINRQYFSFALIKRGYHVDLAEDGFEAIEKAQENDYDLILTDIKMPLMDGYETTVKIKQIPQHENTPIVATSAENISGENKKHFVDTLLKPIKLKQLYSVVNRFCQIDEDVLDFNIKQALEYAYNDKEIMRKMITMFSMELPIQLTLLNDMITRPNYSQASDLIHKMRGSCKTCGALKLDKKLESLSFILPSGELSNIKKSYKDIDNVARYFLTINHNL